jgi:hypothetical protein
VLLTFEQPHSAESFTAIQTQLQSLLSKAGLTVDLRDRSETPARAEFSHLVLFRMKGHCTTNPLPIAALSDERGPLAMAYSSDGKILPFGEVECDRVRKSLDRVLWRTKDSANQSALGTALATVLAHEIYHMLGDRVKHTHDGITKSSLSAHELLDGRLSLPDVAEAAIKTRVQPVR